MKAEFTAIIETAPEGGYWAICPEIPGANGQGETKEECLGNLAEAVQLLLDTGREEAFRLDPQAETAELLLETSYILATMPVPMVIIS